MAQYLSPGVYWNEVDLTTIVPQVSSSVGAFVGDFEWGPVNTIVDVSNEDNLRKYFGRPTDDTYVSFFTASSFLNYTNSLKVVRAGRKGIGLKNATAAGVGVEIHNTYDYEDDFKDINSVDLYGQFAARYPGQIGNSLKVSIFADSGNQLAYNGWEYARYFGEKVPGTSRYVREKGGKNDEIHLIVVDEDGAFTGVPGTILETYPNLSKASDATNDDGSTNYYVDVIHDMSSYIYIVGKPTTSLYNVASAVVFDGGSGLFSATDLPVYGGKGFGATANVTVVDGVVDSVEISSSGTGYYKDDQLVVIVPEAQGAVFQVNTYLDANGDFVTGNANTITILDGGVMYSNANYVPLLGSDGFGLYLSANISVNATGSIVSVEIADEGEGWTDNAIATIATSKQPLIAFQLELSDSVGTHWGQPALNKTFTQDQSHYTNSLSGANFSHITPLEGDIIDGYDLFSSEDSVDVSLILTGDHSSTVCQHIMDVVVGGTSGNPGKGRRDAVVFLSPPKTLVVKQNTMNIAQNIVDWRNGALRGVIGESFSSSYAFMDCNWKKMFDKYNNVARWVPLNGDVAGLCARTDFTNDPWWSPAGFNRGQIKDVMALGWQPNQSDRDTLYSNSINPVLNFKGSGVILYGDKTLTSKPSAFDRINVRRLFITLEKAISKAAKYSLFEFNDQFTRAQFVALIEPYLRDVKGRRGIYDFRVVCDESNNTPEVIDSNKFIGDIYIKPARSINFIQLNFVAVRTGVDFSTIVGKF